MADGLLSSALLLSLQIILPFGIVIVVAGVVASALRTAFQLDEKSVNLAFKLGVLFLALTVFGASNYSELLRFTERIWSDYGYYN